MPMSNGSVAAKLEKRKIEQWEVNDAASTLIRAEEIRQDKKLMPLVEKELEKRRKAVDSVMKRK